MRNSGTSYKECIQCGWDCRPCRCQIESAARQEEENKKIAAKECACGACCQKKCKCRHEVDWTSPETRAQLAALKIELETAQNETASAWAMVNTAKNQLAAFNEDARMLAEVIDNFWVEEPEQDGTDPVSEAAKRILEATKK